MHNFGWQEKAMVGQHQWKLTQFTVNKQCFTTAENKNHPHLRAAFCSFHLDKKHLPTPIYSTRQIHKQLLGDSTSTFTPVDQALGLCCTVAQRTRSQN